MPTIILLITLLTPTGDVTLIAEPYATSATCEAGRVAAMKAMERKPSGFVIREAACHQVGEVSSKATVKAVNK